MGGNEWRGMQSMLPSLPLINFRGKVRMLLNQTTVTRGHTPPRCEVSVLHREATIEELMAALGPHVVVFVDNRPQKPHLYESLIEAYLEERTRADAEGILSVIANHSNDLPENKAILEDLFRGVGPSSEDVQLYTLIEKGLQNGWFRDTAKVAEWLGATNGYGAFSAHGIPPFRLLVVHAEAHIRLLAHALMERKARVAGIYWGGSPLMLHRNPKDGGVLDTPVIQDTLRVIRFGLDTEIPMFGICFGLHLMAYEQFRVLVAYLTPPAGARFQYHPRLDECAELPKEQPGVERRWRAWGMDRVIRIRHDAVLYKAERVPGLKVHSMALLPCENEQHRRSIPEYAMLAVSRRYFLRDRPAEVKRRKEYLPQSAAAISQTILEVVRCGRVAVGVQLHGELTARLLHVLSHLPSVRADLEREGHDVVLIRRQLERYPHESYFAGQRIGYNWTKRELGVEYVRTRLRNKATDGATALQVLRRLLPEGVDHWS